ncbi:MAG: maleylacetoacetate isomerase [Burkholderiales bacterium]|nr:MAG: maleylacetoacetate isomerase [Burkholderiales bacterium]
MLTLYTYFRSSASFRVRIALNVKGLAHRSEVVWLPDLEHHADRYTSLNPQGLVPALQLDGHLFKQSLSIIEYLDETRPEPPLLPRDPIGRARVRSLAQLVACEIHPLNNLRVLKYLKNTLGQSQDAIDTWYRHWCALGLSAFERELADHPVVGRYCHSDAVSMADCCLVPQVFNAQRFKVDLSPYPQLMRVFDACMQLPAFDQAQPAKQPEAARGAG